MIPPHSEFRNPKLYHEGRSKLLRQQQLLHFLDCVPRVKKETEEGKAGRGKKGEKSFSASRVQEEEIDAAA